jgi:DNA polymerase III delta prime subunit
MSTLLLHPQTQERFEHFVNDAPQSILLVAPEGSGKESLLFELAQQIAGEHSAGRIFTLEPEPDKSSIGIEQIRELKTTLRLKSDQHRIVVIPHGELLTTEAQNSFLKLLEEPPKGVHFFMAVTTVSDMLETIQSRTVVWRLVLPTADQIEAYYNDVDKVRLRKAIAIGESRIGLISAILTNESNHELLQAIETAKEILAESKFERLLRVDLLSKDAPQTALVLEALELTCKAALEHAANKQAQSVKQWHKRLTLISEAMQMLAKKVQTKLVLDWLFMKL